jgi:hypothetical protein
MPRPDVATGACSSGSRRTLLLLPAAISNCDVLTKFPFRLELKDYIRCFDGVEQMHISQQPIFPSMPNPDRAEPASVLMGQQ